MTYMYVKNSSPMITRQVVNNLIEAMRNADVEVMHIDTMRLIVAECEKVLADQQAASR